MDWNEDMDAAPKDGTLVMGTNHVMEDMGQTMLMKWGQPKDTMNWGGDIPVGWMMVDGDFPVPPLGGYGGPCTPTKWKPA